MEYHHGGDIYEKNIRLDFSININPLGMPGGARDAAIKGVELSTFYPDWDQRELRKAVSEHIGIDGENLLFGNGAADLIYRLMQVIRPEKVMVPAPSFSEYGKAAIMSGSEVQEFFLYEKDSFSFNDETLEKFIDQIENMAAGSAVFLCNPNNPDGGMIPKKMLLRIYEVCKKNSIWIIVDECFLPFSSREEEYSMVPEIRKRSKKKDLTERNRNTAKSFSNTAECSMGSELRSQSRIVNNEKNRAKYSGFDAENDIWRNLIVLRAFTKIYGMPGLRLGYLVTENQELISRIRETMTPWEINTPAQMAGVAALSDGDYLKETRRMIKEEREFLIDEILRNGLAEKIYNIESEANFILFRVSQDGADLKEKLIEKGILIRSCGDFSGLDRRFFRICVRKHDENAELIETWKNMKM
ncbi:PLP-dependent enzyme, histidinol-phosphate/aromatic aminotransferase or cobyric acid decarboxylase [Lachnospiraceae bacterium JC7]|nr:PLP-dependent enzyme, histidinol-phosphate/aromatic aminotransferase or cobyric acid decarboxylase [Lachnospiraceae bacterium JC7]